MTAKTEKFALVASYRGNGQCASSAVTRLLSENSLRGFHRRPPGARFSLPRRRSQVVRQRSAKPPSPVRLRSAPLHRAFASGRLPGGPFFVGERAVAVRLATFLTMWFVFGANPPGRQALAQLRRADPLSRAGLPRSVRHLPIRSRREVASIGLNPRCCIASLHDVVLVDDFNVSSVTSNNSRC
jgi:hypothetical protein